MGTVDQMRRLLLIAGGAETDADDSAEGDRVTDRRRRVHGVKLSAAGRR